MLGSNRSLPVRVSRMPILRTGEFTREERVHSLLTAPKTLSESLVAKATASRHPKMQVRREKPGWTVGIIAPTGPVRGLSRPRP